MSVPPGGAQARAAERGDGITRAVDVLMAGV